LKLKANGLVTVPPRERAIIEKLHASQGERVVDVGDWMRGLWLAMLLAQDVKVQPRAF